MTIQADNVVWMKDDTTKIRLVKLAGDSGQGLCGARFEVYDSKHKKIMEFISKEKGYDIIGRLSVGEIYTFKEIEAPKGYRLAKPMKYKIKDTGEVQKLSVTDEKQPEPHIPQTGGSTPLAPIVIVLLILCGTGIFGFCGEKVCECWNRRKK